MTDESVRTNGNPDARRQLFPHWLTDIVPSMDRETYERLKASIARVGHLHNAITLYEGQILDGRYRYRACVELGIEPTYRTYEDAVGEGYRGSPRDFVISANFMRKHLTKEQIAEIDRRTTAAMVWRDQGLTYDEIATKLGVSQEEPHARE